MALLPFSRECSPIRIPWDRPCICLAINRIGFNCLPLALWTPLDYVWSWLLSSLSKYIQFRSISSCIRAHPLGQYRQLTLLRALHFRFHSRWVEGNVVYLKINIIFHCVVFQIWNYSAVLLLLFYSNLCTSLVAAPQANVLDRSELHSDEGMRLV